MQSDIKLLKQVLNWACSVTHTDGTRLLERNPLQHVKVKGEHDVARPIASYERFEATRKAMQAFQQRYAEEARALATVKDRARAEQRYAAWVRAQLRSSCSKRRASDAVPSLGCSGRISILLRSE